MMFFPKNGQNFGFFLTSAPLPPSVLPFRPLWLTSKSLIWIPLEAISEQAGWNSILHEKSRVPRKFSTEGRKKQHWTPYGIFSLLFDFCWKKLRFFMVFNKIFHFFCFFCYFLGFKMSHIKIFRKTGENILKKV